VTCNQVRLALIFNTIACGLQSNKYGKQERWKIGGSVSRQLCCRIADIANEIVYDEQLPRSTETRATPVAAARQRLPPVKQDAQEQIRNALTTLFVSCDWNTWQNEEKSTCKHLIRTQACTLDKNIISFFVTPRSLSFRQIRKFQIWVRRILNISCKYRHVY